MTKKREIIQSNETVTPLKTVFENDFTVFLKHYGLPYDGILASKDQKQVISNNIDSILTSIPVDQRRNANYLSRFVSSVAIGRFDSALTDLWNEVVVQLRKSVVLYGIDIFFDAAVSNKDRNDYSKEEDLANIKDRTLLDVCSKLEIFNSIVYRKLVYILDMRNQISASHPNDSVIKAFELLGWLQNSVEDVISVRPSPGAIKVQQFVRNLKSQPSEVSKTELKRIQVSLSSLSTVLAGNLLTTVFGIYTDPKTSNETKLTISQLAPTIWNLAPDQIKYDIGGKLESFTLNLDKQRQQAGEQFFVTVSGNNFKTKNRKSLDLADLTANLLRAHYGWDNYFEEISIVRQIMSYIKNSIDIPVERQEDLIKTFLICRIGKEVLYENGVSQRAVPYYDMFFKLLSSDQIRVLLKVIQDPDIVTNVATPIRQKNFWEILNMLPQSLTDERVQEALNYLKNKPLNFEKKIMSSDFKNLVKVF